MMGDPDYTVESLLRRIRNLAVDKQNFLVNLRCINWCSGASRSRHAMIGAIPKNYLKLTEREGHMVKRCPFFYWN